MKHLFLTALLACGTLAASAQKGSFYIGGQAGFNSTSNTEENNGTKTTTSRASNYSFSPELGTFLSNNFQLGAGFTFSGSRRETPYTGIGNGADASSEIRRYGATVYTRHFFGAGNFRPFVGLNVTVLPGNLTSESGGPNNTTTKFDTFDLGANLNAGFGYGLTERLTVVGSFGTFGYQRTTAKQQDSDYRTTTNNFGLNVNTLGNLFTVGVYYTFIAGEKQPGGN